VVVLRIRDVGDHQFRLPLPLTATLLVRAYLAIKIRTSVEATVPGLGHFGYSLHRLRFRTESFKASQEISAVSIAVHHSASAPSRKAVEGKPLISNHLPLKPSRMCCSDCVLCADRRSSRCTCEGECYFPFLECSCNDHACK
jgi:hypothetical protein